mmetsp:Transcript_8231/g.14918  ORF Transcript_8231/g.14918 Transcript_8231/m.14918 type:complete len:349 (-) Transcript_8231:445-1491(-)
MELAEQENTVPLLLCNHEARQDMTTRVHNLVHDIGSSPTMNTMSKIMNCAGIVNCHHNHLGLLKLGMQQGVASEIVKDPVFIVSFPRTATSILHRTMAHDRERFRNFDLCDVMSPLPPVARQDIEGRQALADKVQKGMLDEMESIFPGYRECLETMHGFRVDEAEEDLGWYDAGLGHMYMDFLMLLYPEFRAKPGGVSSLESKECARYRYAWLDMVMRIYQHKDKAWFDNHGSTEEIKGYGSTDDMERGNRAAASVDSRPWLMKDPNHAAYLPELTQQFPDAKLIFTHRSPAHIVPSMAKLFLCFTSVQHIPGARGTTSEEWGQEVVLRMQHYCQGLVNFAEANKGKP